VEKLNSTTRFKKLLAAIVAMTTIVCGPLSGAGQTDASDKFEIIRAHIQAWLSEASTAVLTISASRLKEEIMDDWSHQSDKYQIISVRKPNDYKTAGHIPHATNIYWVDLMRDEHLERLDPDKILVLYCYYGHGSMISLTILGLLGYKSHSLDFGMMNWNLDALVKEPWDQEADYEVQTDAPRLKGSYPAPALTSDQSCAKGIIKEMAAKYLAGEGSPIVRSSEIKAIVDNWEQKEAEYQIVDVRWRRDYESGHVPNAINIPWPEIAETENLRKLDPHRTVMTCSDNGQVGQVATTVLSLLGYHAVNMLFGMMDWNQAYVDSLDRWDGAASYPVECENQLVPHGSDSH